VNSGGAGARHSSYRSKIRAFFKRSWQSLSPNLHLKFAEQNFKLLQIVQMVCCRSSMMTSRSFATFLSVWTVEERPDRGWASIAISSLLTRENHSDIRLFPTTSFMQATYQKFLCQFSRAGSKTSRPGTVHDNQPSQKRRAH